MVTMECEKEKCKENSINWVKSLPSKPCPNSIYFLKTSDGVLMYVSSLTGVLTQIGGSSQGGDITITSPDSSITVTENGQDFQVKVSDILQSLIQSALQPGNNVSELVNDAGYLTELEEQFQTVATDSYVGDRLVPVDANINGLLINKNSNTRNGFEAVNVNTGNGATSSIVARGSANLYEKSISMQWFGSGYFVPYLRDKGAITSTNDIIIAPTNNTGVDFKTGSTISTLTTKMKLDGDGTLNITTQPITDNTVTKGLARKSDGKVVEFDIQGETLQDLQSVTDEGQITTNSMAIIGESKSFNVNSDSSGDNSAGMYLEGTTPKFQIRKGLVDYNIYAQNINSIVNRQASNQSGYEVVSVNGNLADSNGNLTLPITEQGVQSIEALDPLAIDNSDPYNPILNVTTPEYVQELFDSIPPSSGNVDLKINSISSSNLTTLDKAGFLIYINSLNPNVVIPSNQVLIYIITETQQRFEILKNNTTIGLGQTALTTTDVLDYTKVTLSVPNLTPHSIVWIGDSIISGFGLSDTSKRYSTLVSGALGYTESNLGIAGTSVKTQATTIIPTKTSSSKYLVIGYGTNDRAIGGNTAANFQSDLTNFVNAAIAKGWVNTDIILVTMPGYQLQTGVADTTIRAYNTSILNVATNLGTKYLDFYDTMIVNSPYGSVKTLGNLTNDGTHPNVLGSEAHYKIFTNSNLIEYIFNVSGKSLISGGNSEIKNLKLSNFSYKVSGNLLGMDTLGNVYPLTGLPDAVQAEGDIIFSNSLIQKDALVSNPAYRSKDLALLRGIRIFAGYDNVNHNRIDICEDNGDFNIRNHNSSGNLNLYSGTSALPLLGLQVQKNGMVNTNLGITMPFSNTIYLTQTAGGSNYGRLNLFDTNGYSNIENAHASGRYQQYTSGGTTGGKVLQKTMFVSGREQLQNGGTFTDIPSARLAINSTTEGLLIPRLTTAQRDAIVSPANGLQIYNTTNSTIDIYSGTIWTSLVNQNTILTATSVLDFPSTAPASNSDLTITVTGASLGDAVSIGTPPPPTSSEYSAFVSAPDTVTIRLLNSSAVAVNPTSATFKVKVFK